MLLIGFAGCPGAGKTTLARALAAAGGQKCVVLHLADPLKRMLRALGLRPSQLHGGRKNVTDPFWQVTPRRLMQAVGTELLRERLGEVLPELGCTDNIWLRCLDRKLEQLRQQQQVQVVCIADVRLPVEADWLASRGGSLIYVQREGAGLPVGSAESQHSSEQHGPLLRAMADEVLHNHAHDREALRTWAWRRWQRLAEDAAARKISEARDTASWTKP